MAEKEEGQAVLPLITIGITCHNAGDTIVRAIGSALSQDWPELEVVVVDDCSTDGSPELVAKAISEEARARLVRHEQNTGVAGARNTIIKHARGEFIAYFDDDDDNVQDRLRAQYERIISYELRTGAELVFCYSDRNVVKVGQTVPDHVGLAIGRTAPEPYGPAVADYLLAIDMDRRFVWGMMGSCTLMARRKAYQIVGGFDDAFRRCGELELAIRAAFLGAHFISVDRPLITQYKTQSADKSGSVPLKYSLMLREKHRDYLEGRGLYFASRALACSNFYRNKKRMLKSRAYRLLAFLVGPSLLAARLMGR